MSYTTYNFTAYTYADLFGGGSMTKGSTFDVPANASVRMTVSDDETILSDDLRLNERADDLHVSGATITDADGNSLGNGDKIFGEGYVVVHDAWGNEFRMVQIEQQGTGDIYFAFDTDYGMPAAGAHLTVERGYDVNKWFGNIPRYHDLTGGDIEDPTPTTDPTPEDATICGRLFFDADRDGTEFNNEGRFDEGLAGRTVFLLDARDNVVDQTRTDANGEYAFDGVTPGYYSVRFIHEQGYDFTTRSVGDDRYDSDVSPRAGETATFYAAVGEKVSDIDAGIVVAQGTITGTIWKDSDCDGLQQASTEELGDVVMSAYARQRSDFTKVVTVESAGTYELTYDQIASRYAKNMFENGVELYVNGALIDTNIHKYKNEHTYKIELEEGRNEITFEPTTNFTARQPYIDDITLREVKTIDPEPGMAGVTVNLLNASGEVVAQTVTDADGNYSFGDLPLGTYTVMGVSPDGTEFTLQNVGSNDTIDSDVNAHGLSTVTIDSSDNIDIDMGICKPADPSTGAIGDQVFKDYNKNGVFDKGDLGLLGVNVELLADLDGDGEVDDVLATTRTDWAGKYLFEGLEAGEYAVRFELPSWLEWADESIDPADLTNNDNDAGPGGVTDVFYLAEGQQQLNIDAGMVWNPDPYSENFDTDIKTVGSSTVEFNDVS